MDYSKYNIEDLASDQTFVDWVYQKDSEAVAFWDHFLLEHPEQKTKINRARTLVLNLRQSQNISFKEDQIDQLWERISVGVSAGVSSQVKSLPQKEKRRSRAMFMLISLAVIIVMGGSYFYFQFVSGRTDDSNFLSLDISDEYIEEVNSSAANMLIHLSDGSVVTLGRESRLRYKKDYESDSSRHVYLLGEAFFEVTKDPYKPFFVHANEVVTEVLGTSFNVQARKEDTNVVVSVKTGRVSVYSAKELTPSSDRVKNGVILLPNQEVMYRREKQSFDRKLVEEPTIVAPSVKQSDFLFDNTPVGDAFTILQEAYGVEIIFNDDILNNCFITAPLGSEPLFEKLQIICRTIGATYEIVDAKVIITSSGC